jgi:hypothetical protein
VQRAKGKGTVNFRLGGNFHLIKTLFELCEKSYLSFGFADYHFATGKLSFREADFHSA